MEKQFDLNIEQVLEHWGIEDAIRELIANAIDEQMLTNSQEIEIFRGFDMSWHIKDYGRGLNYHHFTQNENPEKLEHPNLIGKFGVGLKDALAVFYRHEIKVDIFSKYAHITLGMRDKEGFNVETLHAVFNDPLETNMQGTEIVLSGVYEEDMNKAKAMFLKFSEGLMLESTQKGDVYTREPNCGHIYVNGVRVASEDNFMFSYNITNINASIKKSLNRERSNVGRTAYASNVKMILQSCQGDEVLHALVADLNKIMEGTAKDESGWVDVSAYAVKTLDKKGTVVFIDTYGLTMLTNQQREILEQSGKDLIVVPSNVLAKVGNTVRTFEDVMVEYEDSFEYEFVDYNELTKTEQDVFDSKGVVIDFLKKRRYQTNFPIYISENIRVNAFGDTTQGIFDGSRVIIRRSVLASHARFMGVLIHEFAHATSGYEDNTRDFENVLTQMLGQAMYEIGQTKEPKRSLYARIFNRV